ncbi:hypothetical protein Tco_1341516, partial [Tanacetum coccineum]
LRFNEMTTAEVQQREAFIERSKGGKSDVVNEKLQLRSIEHNKKT